MLLLALCSLCARFKRSMMLARTMPQCATEMKVTVPSRLSFPMRSSLWVAFFFFEETNELLGRDSTLPFSEKHWEPSFRVWYRNSRKFWWITSQKVVVGTASHSNRILRKQLNYLQQQTRKTQNKKSYGIHGKRCLRSCVRFETELPHPKAIKSNPDTNFRR